MINKKMRPGNIEIELLDYKILNSASILPFNVNL